MQPVFSQHVLLVVLFTFTDLWAANTNGEFEGTYQVGETLCVVTPVKTAFEVQCQAEHNSGLFFYEWQSETGQYSYASEGKASGIDRIIFMDESFFSGVFIRSDGDRFRIEKVIVQ